MIMYLASESLTIRTAKQTAFDSAKRPRTQPQHSPSAWKRELVSSAGAAPFAFQIAGLVRRPWVSRPT